MVGSETAILDMAGSRFYGAQETAADIWEWLSEPIRLGAIERRLLGRYRVDAAICRRDTVAFLEKLLSRGLVTVVPSEPTT